MGLSLSGNKASGMVADLAFVILESPVGLSFLNQGHTGRKKVSIGMTWPPMIFRIIFPMPFILN